MRNNYLSHNLGRLTAVLLLACGGGVFLASAQTLATARPPAPVIVEAPVDAPARTAGVSDLYCGGTIELSPSFSGPEIVGAEQEQEQHSFAEGDYVFVSVGTQQGVRVGQEFLVVRPRGKFSSDFSRKKGTLGMYIQEVGRLRVTEAKDRAAVAVVTHSCDQLLLGDLLRPLPLRTAPLVRAEVAGSRFSDPNGKPQGRIVLARDGREMPTRNEIVYIDLGSEDSVKTGDYLTIFRPAGAGSISHYRDVEIATAGSGGFQSDAFKGGKFSSQAQRVKDQNGTSVLGPTVNSPKIKARRPPVPRKVVGEMVVLNVQARTATALITRIAQEIFTGDFVEVQ